MSVLMARLVGGELDIVIPWTGRRDEIGRMAGCLSAFQTAAVEKLQLQEAARLMALVKDRRQAAADRYTQDFGATVSGVMQSLTGSAEAMSEAADAMSIGAAATHKQAVVTADGASASADSLSTVAAATERMEASVREVSRQVREAAAATVEAVQRADQTDTRMRGLALAADRIGAVVGLINGIANKTNLLALNATIEAARAGDAGRGFAVVASEVRSLAAQTARATQEIGRQIGEIRQATIETVATVRAVGEAIQRADGASRTIASAVDEQSRAMQEISRSVQIVAGTTQAASIAMQTISSMAEDAGGSSRRVQTTAESVTRMSVTLRQEVLDFLAAVSRTEEDVRRRYERVPGRGARATLRAGGREQQFEVHDISRGGAALICDWRLEPGTDVALHLPSSAEPVMARIVRQTGDHLALSFRQDLASLAQLDGVLQTLAAAA
jgi:methyl-accepting chemotaxis protein